jgi:hypothetical protein
MSTSASEHNVDCPSQSDNMTVQYAMVVYQPARFKTYRPANRIDRAPQRKNRSNSIFKSVPDHCILGYWHGGLNE